MKIRLVVLAAALAAFASGAGAQVSPPNVNDAADANHFIYWLGSDHLADYTEWWYFNVYDSSNNVQAIFSYLINNPLNLPGGLFPIGITEVAAAAFTPKGIVNDPNIFLTLQLSAKFSKADVNVANQDTITVVNPDTYQIAGSTRDGHMSWNLTYQRQAPSWYAASRFSVAAEPWQLMSWLLYMPRANVTGTLTVNGTKYNIHGPGYHDHNWGEWNLNGVTWNWAQYSQPGFTFDLGDFPQKPGGVASIEWNGKRFVFDNSQYTLTHTQWALDTVNNVEYPTQSVFHASNGAAQVDLTMNVLQTDPLAPPGPLPKSVIYEQTVTYTGHAWIEGREMNFAGNGFKEYTAVAQ